MSIFSRLPLWKTQYARVVWDNRCRTGTTSFIVPAYSIKMIATVKAGRLGNGCSPVRFVNTIFC